MDSRQEAVCPPPEARPPGDLTCSQAVGWCQRRLAAAGIESARTEAELLVGEVLGRGRDWLFLHPHEPLSADQQDRLVHLLARRAAREPLPYLLGRAEFYGLTFRVGPAAIIPRPETEILVEAALARARASRCELAVDVGAGCGAIAVVFAKHLPSARVLAIDISPAALRLARENCRRHQVAERVSLVCTDLLTAIGPGADAIIANLPYIRREEFPQLQPEVREFEPRLALDGGEDGLAIIRRLSVQLFDHLRPDGFAALEVGAGQAPRVAKLLEDGGLSQVETLADYAGIARVVIGWRKG